MNKKLTIIPCLGILAVMVGASHAGRGLAQFSASAAPAAPLGTAFTYQGYLTDGDSPAEGVYDLRFILYDSAPEGGQVGSTLEVADLAVSQGLLTAALDFGSGPFNRQALWLEVGVRPGGSSGEYTPLSPRQALSAAPYALNADQLDGQHASAFASAAHNHLGETWSGSGSSLVITGTFGAPYTSSLVLGNSGGDALAIPWAAGAGVYVGSAGEHGVLVSSAGRYGLSVYSAGGDGVYVESADGDGFRVESAGYGGIQVDSAGMDGVDVGSAVDDGVYIGSAGDYGVFVDEAVDDALWGDTLNAANEWGVYTPDKISAMNVTAQSFVLQARAAGPESLMPGDLVSAVGIGDPLPESSEPLALVRLADASAHPAVIGVVQARIVYAAQDGQDGEDLHPPELHSADGPALPGDYVAIFTNGVARARVADPGGEIQPGARLAAADLPGAARPLRSTTVDGIPVSEGAPVLGVALGTLDAEGYARVLVNPQ